jgi:pimeloyl-ACP methyl ester carboxylesterase
MSSAMQMGDIRNATDERLDVAFTAASTAQGPCVVIGHGVTANKDRDWAVTLAGALAEAGFGSLRFSFSGNGDSEGDFRESTVSKEVDDLGAVLDALGDHPSICYAGHSMGAAVGVLRAAKDPRIRYLISLAGMVHTAEFARRKFGDLVPGKDLMWDKPECPLSQAFMADMARVESTLPLAPRIQVPWLLVHGTADTVVPYAESQAMCAAAPINNDALVTIQGADHLFSGVHAAPMARTVVDWLRRVVRKKS